MKKVISIGLFMIMFLSFSGCFWWHEREEHERERGGYGEHERGYGDHEHGGYGGGDRR